MKLNSKRSETESGTQPRSIRDQNDPSIGSKLEPFMKLNSKRSETESGTQPRSIRDQNDPSIGSKLKPFMKLNSKRSQTEFGTRGFFCGHDVVTTARLRRVTTQSPGQVTTRASRCGFVVTTQSRQGHDTVTVTTRSRRGHDEITTQSRRVLWFRRGHNRVTRSRRGQAKSRASKPAASSL